MAPNVYEFRATYPCFNIGFLVFILNLLPPFCSKTPIFFFFLVFHLKILVLKTKLTTFLSFQIYTYYIKPKFRKRNFILVLKLFYFQMFTLWAEQIMYLSCVFLLLIENLRLSFFCCVSKWKEWQRRYLVIFFFIRIF